MNFQFDLDRNSLIWVLIAVAILIAVINGTATSEQIDSLFSAILIGVGLLAGHAIKGNHPGGPAA